jgi:hypothetical protein
MVQAEDPPFEIKFDMDPSGNTPPTDLSGDPPVPHQEAIGSIESCRRVDPTAPTDVIGIDVVIEGYDPEPIAYSSAVTLAQNIPASGPGSTLISYTSTEDPVQGGDAILIDNERIHVMSVDVDANTLNVLRGIGDTTPATHSSGANIVRADGMMGLGASLEFDDGQLTPGQVDTIGDNDVFAGFIVSSYTWSAIVTTFQDQPGDGEVAVAAVETGPRAASEVGSGVLFRLPVTLGVDTDADNVADQQTAPGVYTLELPAGEAVIEAQSSTDFPSNSPIIGLLAVGVDCPPGGGCGESDVDGDGYSGCQETHLGTEVADRCTPGIDATKPSNPSLAWPADLNATPGSVPSTVGLVNILDITSFLAPERRLDTSPNDPFFDVRWDLVPGPGIFGEDINIEDLTNLIVITPPMPPFHGTMRAFDGPACIDT